MAVPTGTDVLQDLAYADTEISIERRSCTVAQPAVMRPQAYMYVLSTVAQHTASSTKSTRLVAFCCGTADSKQTCALLLPL